RHVALSLHAALPILHALVRGGGPCRVGVYRVRTGHTGSHGGRARDSRQPSNGAGPATDAPFGGKGPLVSCAAPFPGVCPAIAAPPFRTSAVQSMHDSLSALLLGILEGLTELLPASSTGHLLIAQHQLGARSCRFHIGSQAGAILAITLVFRQRLWSLATGLDQRENRDYLAKLAMA